MESHRKSLLGGAKLEAKHFKSKGRLAVLMMPPGRSHVVRLHRDGRHVANLPVDVTVESTETVDIRLLSARKLIKHIDGGGRMETRQTLQEQGIDIFLTAAETQAVLAELETTDTRRCLVMGNPRGGRIVRSA